MPGRGAFERCVESVSARGGARSPRGVCASAGRKKYGAKKFQAMAAAGRRRKSRKNSALDSTLDQLLSFTPTGTALKAVEQQREKLQRKMNRQNRSRKNVSWRKSVKHTKKALRRLGVKDWNAPILAKKAYKAGRKKNPRNPVDTAQERYQSFHGRPSEELVDIVTPLHEHSVVAGIGDLKKLEVITADGHKVIIKNFGVNRHGQPAYLTMNEAATQLFIDGGDQSVNLEDFGILEPYREWETLGQVKQVWYFTTKDHLGADGGTATYRHKFGGVGEYRVPSTGRMVRKRSRLPDLIYDVRNQLLYFSGGGYTIPDEGIDN